jgi:hypothetical protein
MRLAETLFPDCAKLLKQTNRINEFKALGFAIQTNPGGFSGDSFVGATEPGGVSSRFFVGGTGP